ncbi:MAG: glycosyltransferase family 2 protein [Flavobacteriaceae bacterium]
MNTPISILIPTYNYNVYPLVKEIHTQASLLNVPFEIVVVDDGSEKQLTNQSLLQNLSHTKLITFKENKGRSAARGFLAKTASYDYLLFLDADVMPADIFYLKKYLENLKNNVVIAAGGVLYQRSKPEKDKILRYKYGIGREEKTPVQRNKENNIIVSANLLIKKEIFQKINTVTHNFYGDDLLLSSNIMKLGIKVLHIDNPVIHLGLESNQVFLKKSLTAVESLVALEKSKDLPGNLTKIQKTYKILKKNGLHVFTYWILGIFKKPMKINLLSNHPSLFLFDLYRLHHYISIKNE